MADAAAEFVKAAKELPVMPPIATEVMRKAEDPDTDLPTIAGLISRDAALAVRVLKIANSSFYSMPRKIETIQQAIVLLGYSTLRSVVVAAALKDVFARFGLAERLLWEHAVAGGVAANVIAGYVGGLNKDEAFVGGLVHDVGKLVMHSQEETKYQEVMRAVYADEAEPIVKEREIFGFDHTEVGRLLLGRWKLPESLAAAVGAHHDPENTGKVEGARPHAALLQVADKVALRAGCGRRKPSPEIQPWACKGAEILNLDEADLAEIDQKFQQLYEQEKELLT